MNNTCNNWDGMKDPKLAGMSESSRRPAKSDRMPELSPDGAGSRQLVSIKLTDEEGSSLDAFDGWFFSLSLPTSLEAVLALLTFSSLYSSWKV